MLIVSNDSDKAQKITWLLMLGSLLQEGASMKQKPAATSSCKAPQGCLQPSITGPVMHCSKNRGLNLISIARLGSALTHFRTVQLHVIVLLESE